MHSDKELNVKFVCNHLIQFNNESRAEFKEATSSTSKAALVSQQAKPLKSSKSSSGPLQLPEKRCKSGYHNPNQDQNHTSDNCWHLHPDKAPDWWRESQAQWKASKEKEKEGYFMSLLTLWVESGDPKSRIILDSGASAHIFNNLNFFDKIKMGSFDVIKTGKHGATLPIEGRGSVQLLWGQRKIKLKNCLYVPNIVINLISAGELNSKGCTVLSKGHGFTVTKGDQLVFKGRIDNNLREKSDQCWFLTSIRSGYKAKRKST
jgi:hypothetical protein